MVQVLERAGDLVDRRPQPLEQVQAGLGHRHAAGRAVQQAHSEALLQLPHRMAKRGRCDAEPRRGGAEAALLGDGGECGEVGEVNAVHW